MPLSRNIREPDRISLSLSEPRLVSRFQAGRIALASVAFMLANVALAQAPAEPPQKSEKAAERPPIAFFVAEGEPDACGPGCSAWIAAMGPIDHRAALRLRATLDRVKDRKLPIYFFSPGGNGMAAMEIGRVLRQAGAAAGVGRTTVEECPSNDERCQKLVQSGRPLRAKLDFVDAVCASACVFALVGAAKRDIHPRARVGVHRAMSVGVPGPPGYVVVDPDPHLILRIGRYLRDMGIDHGLYELMASTPNQRIRYLTPDEIERWIVTR
jgi:hypothetical protein